MIEIFWDQELKTPIIVKDNDITTLSKTNTEYLATISSITTNNIKAILKKYYKLGFKIDFIEFKRFRINFKEEFHSELMLNDEELNFIIFKETISYGGKRFYLDSDIFVFLKDEVSSLIDSGIIIIYYSELYKLYSDIFIEYSIVDSEMLQIILEAIFPEYKFLSNYCIFLRSNRTKSQLIKDEILRIWGNTVLLDDYEISNRLPFIPFPYIKEALGREPFFVRNSKGRYTHLERFIINEEEKEHIIAYVDKEIINKNYISLNELPIDSMRVDNFHLSDGAIQMGIYEILFADKYIRQGKVISYEADNITTMSIMRDYCRNHDRCSLQELIKLEIDLTSEIHYSLAMESGYSEMVRVDKNLFVADKFVEFNIDNIDKAIDYFIKDQYLPLQKFTVFATFPDCSFQWNLFLLESYCRRFSKQFSFDVLAYNSMNVGVVKRKVCTLSYHEIMIDAISKSNIELIKTEVLGFLYDNGYIGKRTYSKINDLIKKVKLKN